MTTSIGNIYPNPFNALVTIEYQLETASDVRLCVFDILGRKVETLVNERKRSGRHSFIWDASHLPSGVYFCRFAAQNNSQTRRLLLLK